MGVFSQCQFVLDLDSTQVPYKKKQHLRKEVTNNGGVTSYILTKKTSYLVSSNGAKTADSYKGRTAQRQGVPIVGVGFIERCVEEGRVLDHDDFLLVGSTASMQFSSGKITATKTPQETKKQVRLSSFNINKFKVWQWGSVSAPAYPEDNYEVAKSVLLQKVETRTKERSFYQLELHIVPDDVFDGAGDLRDIDPKVEQTFRVFAHRGVLNDMKNEDSGTREVMYCSSSEEALELYSFLYNQQHSMTRCKKQASQWIGSPRYRQTRLAILAGGDEELSPDVASLVEGLWKETLGELQDVLAVDIKTLSADKVIKAESILLLIKKALDVNDNDERQSKTSVEELSQEFYSQIPHKTQHKKDIKTKSMIAKKQDLCQLIKDIVSVSETTNWSQRSSVESKYRALRCHITCLPVNHPEYYDVKNLIVSTQEDKRVEILHVFAVTRPLELTSYNTKLHNSRLLFHASRPANFVGILSRGLVLPKVVVDDFGGERTDAGMLGGGIYFSDSFSTSAKYSHPSNTRGTRLMIVNQVALGECHDTTSYLKDLTKPPEGFHSVHGVRKDGTNYSDFKDDEYAVYSTNQQRIRYLVEFTLPDDKPTSLPVSDNEGALDTGDDSDVDINTQEDQSDTIDLSDVQSIEDPFSKIQPGLLSNTDQPIPLKAVHVRARLLDLAAQVVVLQVYANDSDYPIEAKYVFPLDEQAAVCGFEAFINDKHIVAEVKEKETAHREYKEAISKGHGAYLMDEERPDVFTVSVGNLPPKTTVVIKITYVAELTVDGDKILFGLPGSVAPWRKDEALAQEIQTDVKTVKVNTDTERSLSVHVAVEMPYDIQTLQSPTHPIKHKRTATKATVCLSDTCTGLDDGFQLLIGLAEIHVPRMWVERHPTDKDSQACMLTFYPEFEADSSGQSEVVLLLDLSNSMQGGNNQQEAKKLVLLILHHLSKNWKFNIVVFGTEFEELFPQSKVKNTETMKSAYSFIQGVSATMGNTDVWRPLGAYFMLKSGQLQNIFFISDGHISNEDTTLETVRKNCRHTRVFTFGVSATANKYLLRAVSSAGAGAFEYFDNKTKSKWENKVKMQLSRASQPVLSSVKVDWCQFNHDAPPPIQAPNHITSLFSGSRQVVYGFVPYCTQATLMATVDGKEVSTMVSTHDLSITQGKILHQLTARNIIRDWEEGSLATDHTQHEAKKAEQKTFIISLSKKYSIVTQFTSFVAVEVRDKSEQDTARSGVNVTDLLLKEAVDSLAYLDWQQEISHDVPEEIEASPSESSIEELLKQAAIDASFSVLRAEQLYEKLTEMLLRESSLIINMDKSLLKKAKDQILDFYGNTKCDKDMVDTLANIFEGGSDSNVSSFDYEDSDESYDELGRVSDLEDDYLIMDTACLQTMMMKPVNQDKKQKEIAELLELQEDVSEGIESAWFDEVYEDEDDWGPIKSQEKQKQKYPALITEEEKNAPLRFGLMAQKTGWRMEKMVMSLDEAFEISAPVLECESEMEQQQQQQYQLRTLSKETDKSLMKKKKKSRFWFENVQPEMAKPEQKAVLQQMAMPSRTASLQSIGLFGGVSQPERMITKDVASFQGGGFGEKGFPSARRSKKELSADADDRILAMAPPPPPTGSIKATFEEQSSPSGLDESQFYDSAPSPPTPYGRSAGGFSVMQALPSFSRGPVPASNRGVAFGAHAPPPPQPPQQPFRSPQPTESSRGKRHGEVQSRETLEYLLKKREELSTSYTAFGSSTAKAIRPQQPPKAYGVGMFDMSAQSPPPLPSCGFAFGAQQVHATSNNLFGGLPPPPPPPPAGFTGFRETQPGPPKAKTRSYGMCLPPLRPLPRPLTPTQPPILSELGGGYFAGQASVQSQPRQGAGISFGGRAPASRNSAPFQATVDGRPSTPPATLGVAFRAEIGFLGAPSPPPSPPPQVTPANMFGTPLPKPTESSQDKVLEGVQSEIRLKRLSLASPKKGPLTARVQSSQIGFASTSGVRSRASPPSQYSQVPVCTARRLEAAPELSLIARSAPHRRYRRTANSVDVMLKKKEQQSSTSDPDLEIGYVLEEPKGENEARIDNGKADFKNIMSLIGLQSESGWWDLSAVFQSVVGVSIAYVSQMLTNAGVKSLGTDVAVLLEQLVATYLVILHLNDVLRSTPIHTVIGRQRELILDSVLKAERWMNKVEAGYPSMARRLELGSSWDEVCKKLFQKMSK